MALAVKWHLEIRCAEMHRGTSPFAELYLLRASFSGRACFLSVGGRCSRIPSLKWVLYPSADAGALVPFVCNGITASPCSGGQSCVVVEKPRGESME